MLRAVNPGFWWWDEGFSRKRLSWRDTLDCPLTMVYDGLDPEAEYLLRMTGNDHFHIRATAMCWYPPLIIRASGTQGISHSQTLTTDRNLTLVWDTIEQSELNWRDYATVAEVWLLKK